MAEPLEGPAAVADHAERLWAAFPDARLQKLGARLTDGRFVAAPTKLLATHREPLGGVPATNKFIVVPAVFYCELEHGKLLRVRAFFDVYGAAVQLGRAARPRDARREGAADAPRLRPACRPLTSH